MIPIPLRHLTPALLGLAVLAASCTKDTAPLKPATDVPLPDVPQAIVPTNVRFLSADSAAVEAEIRVETSLAEAAVIANFGSEYTDPLSDARWGSMEDGCRIWSYPQVGCVLRYELCDGGPGLEWSLTADGSCGGGTIFYIDDVVYRGTEAADGRSGTAELFPARSITPYVSWVWEAASDSTPPTWTYYGGEVASGQPLFILTSDQAGDSTFVSLESPRDQRWEAHISADLAGGTMRYDRWDGDRQEYIRLEEINWADGTGSAYRFDFQGNIDAEYHWQ